MNDKDLQELVREIRALLKARGIPCTLTDEEIMDLIRLSMTLAGVPLIDRFHTDYVRDYSGDTYITNEYPVKNTDTVNILLDGHIIHPHHIDPSGRVYFQKTINGELEVKYLVGVSDEVLWTFLVPIVCEIIREQGYGRLQSITEGDISLSMDVIHNTCLTLDSLIKQLRSYTDCRVTFI